MGRMERLSIELSREISEIVDAAVASGEFASASEVVTLALTEWNSSRPTHGYTVEELRALVDEAEASGDLIDGDEAFRQIRQELDAHIIGRR